jgi:hypothetical protein
LTVVQSASRMADTTVETLAVEKVARRVWQLVV